MENKYLSKKLVLQKDNVKHEIMIAKNLSEYEGRGIKELFFLDFILPNNGGFLGGCKVRENGINVESENSKYHSLERLTPLNIHHNGSDYKLLNDSGLHTKPYIENTLYPQITPPSPYLLWGGSRSRISVRFASAYYLPTETREVKIYRENGTLIGTYPCGWQLAKGDEILIVELSDYLQPGIRIKIEVLATNAEGTTTIVTPPSASTEVGPEVDLPYLVDYYESSGDELFRPNVSPTDTILINTFTDIDWSVVGTSASQTGIHLYTDIRMNRATLTHPNKPPMGYYNLGHKTSDNKNKYYFVDQHGEVTKYVAIGGGTSLRPSLIPEITIHGTIGIRVVNNTGGTITTTVNSLLYYPTKNAINSIGAQSLNYPISYSGNGLIETGIVINRMGEYGAFTISPQGNIQTPKEQLMSTVIEH